MTFLHDKEVDEKITFNLISAGLNKEMDVIHHFIKNIFVKKARFLSVEIFESPPHAILTLAKHNSQKPVKMSKKPDPTHIVKIGVSKRGEKDDDYNMNIDVKFLPKKQFAFKQWFVKKRRGF